MAGESYLTLSDYKYLYNKCNDPIIRKKLHRYIVQLEGDADNPNIGIDIDTYADMDD